MIKFFLSVLFVFNPLFVNQAGAMSDLMISSIVITEGEFNENGAKQITTQAVIENIGDEDSPVFNVEMYINDELISSSRYRSLSPGDSEGPSNVGGGSFYAPDNYEVKFVIVPDGNDATSFNNTLTREFEVVDSIERENALWFKITNFPSGTYKWGDTFQIEWSPKYADIIDIIGFKKGEGGGYAIPGAGSGRMQGQYINIKLTPQNTGDMEDIYLRFLVRKDGQTQIFESDKSFSIKNNPFPDTDLSSLEGKAAMELHKREIISGYPDGEFKGNLSVNRAEAAKFLLTAKGTYIGNLRNLGRFSDVEAQAWYEKYVMKAERLGIINGYPNGEFRPGSTVNTVEFLKMLSKTFELPENLDYDYEDVSDSDWFAKYVGVAQEYDLFPYRSSKLLQPGKKMTRNEVAVAIYKYLESIK